MFSVPAIFILGYGSDFNPVLLTFGAIAGAFLGIGFIIPLRKQMIDFERLTYPGGVAVATILKSPGAGIHKAMLLIGGALLSGGLHAVSQASGVDNWDLGSLVGMPAYMNGVWYLSLLTIGVGYIAGKGGVAFIIGGYVCYWIIAPLLGGMDLFPVDPASGVVTAEPDALRLLLFRPVGIGMLIGGAVAGVAMAFPMIVSAVRSMQSAAKSEAAMSRDEMPIKLLYTAIGGATILLAVMAVLSTEKMGLGRGLLMAVVGTLWIWIAGVILSEAIGRTNWSPLSGMTLIAVTILIFISSGLGDTTAAVVSPSPLEIKIRMVTAIRVMPDSGDQLVRPMASDRMTPAIQTHRVPTRAIIRPRPKPILSVDRTAMTASRTAAPPMAAYSNLIGISSRLIAASDLAALCMLRTALTIIGKAMATPATAPPISMPMPTGRNSSSLSASGSAVTSLVVGSTGNRSSPPSIGAMIQ